MISPSRKVPTGEGHGVEGRFIGLPDPYGSEDFAAVTIIPIPFDKTTTYCQGTDKGPEAIIESSRNLELYDIETDSEVYKKGIYTAPPVEADTVEMMIKLGHNRVLDQLKRGKFVVTLGGEHTISYAPIKAHAEHFGEITILQFDAHTDLAQTYGDTPWSHACVMARAKELPNVKKLVSVGIRSMAQQEVEHTDPVCTFFAHELTEDNEWINRVLGHLSGQIYITFDVDAFDPSLMPSTGTPEPGGLFWNQTMRLLKRVFSEKNVIGFDVVELLPRAENPSCDFVAAKLVYKMLSYKFL